MRSSVDGMLAAVPHPPPLPQGFGLPHVNPATGLSTDYLNHFTEAIMALEMVTTMPECLPDLEAWEPKTYREHFATSHFRNRDAVIEAYEAADPRVREALDAAAETLNAVLAETRDVVVAHMPLPVTGELAARAVAWLKPLIARTAAVINGTIDDPASERRDTQAVIDELFAR